MTKVSVQSKMAEYSKWVGRMGSDSRMMSTHVSLFTALFVCWHHGGFNSPFAITRRKLMAHSRIASIATYHKCIRELDEFGYICYKPSYHPKMGSLVYFPPEYEPINNEDSKGNHDQKSGLKLLLGNDLVM